MSVEGQYIFGGVFDPAIPAQLLHQGKYRAAGAFRPLKRQRSWQHQHKSRLEKVTVTEAMHDADSSRDSEGVGFGSCPFPSRSDPRLPSLELSEIYLVVEEGRKRYRTVLHYKHVMQGLQSTNAQDVETPVRSTSPNGRNRTYKETFPALSPRARNTVRKDKRSVRRPLYSEVLCPKAKRSPPIDDRYIRKTQNDDYLLHCLLQKMATWTSDFQQFQKQLLEALRNDGMAHGLEKTGDDFRSKILRGQLPTVGQEFDIEKLRNGERIPASQHQAQSNIILATTPPKKKEKKERSIEEQERRRERQRLKRQNERAERAAIKETQKVQGVNASAGHVGQPARASPTLGLPIAFSSTLSLPIAFSPTVWSR